MHRGPDTRAAWFVFTDLQDSTRLWDDNRDAMEAALALHDARLHDTVTSSGGRIVKHTGDGVLAVFDDPRAAVRAAIAAQLDLAETEWATCEQLRVRIGVHGGLADDPDDGWFERGDDFVGPGLHRCARVMAAARGGQTLCSSRVADAISDSRDAEIELVDLGIHALRGLARPERVFEVRHPALSHAVPAVVQETPNNLPVPRDEFVGREREAEEIIRLVRRHRLVTLTGVGGVGKTRLALHVAGELLHEFSDGVRFVSLAPISHPELVPSTVAQVLGIRERAGTSLVDSIVEALANRRILLVLDNCEHLIDAAAQLATVASGTGAGPRVLTTSREMLDVPGEHGWSVPVLEVPAPGASIDDVSTTAAAQLLVDRARGVRADFVIGEENVDDVIDLCRRLDGIPLALELAAGRLDAMTAGEIIERLDRRFRLLGRARAREPRHGTLREAIDWSHELLAAEEQVLFRRLAVFVGGFDVTSAEAVTAGGIVDEFDVADVLARLVRKSMVVVTQSGRRSRFRLLETLRQYARERLADAAEHEVFADAHADHFVELAETLASDLRGSGQADAYAVLWRELDNLRAAFDRLLEHGDAERALRMIRITRTFWAEHLPAEGLQRALAATRAGDRAPASLLAGGLADASWIAHVLGHEDANRYATASLETSSAANLPPDPEALMTLAINDLFAGDTGAALGHFEEAREVAQQIGDRYEIAAAATGLCIVRAIVGDDEQAVRDGDEAVEIGRELGYDTQIAAGLAGLGFAYGATDPVRAVSLLEQSFALKSDTTYSTVARVVAGHLHAVLGNPSAALVHFRESLRSYLDYHDVVFVPTALEGLANVLHLVGAPGDAARLLGAADAAREKLGIPGLEIERQLRQVAEHAVSSLMGAEAFRAATLEGRRWTLDDAIAGAFEIFDEHAASDDDPNP